MYGYGPIAFTTTPPGKPLENGWPFCLVTTLLTNSRLISLPFSDHVGPLGLEAGDSSELLEMFARMAGVSGCRFVELRPSAPNESAEDFAFKPCRRENLHRLDLRPPIEEIYGALNYSTVKRKLNRAARENLRYETGTSDALLDAFYRLTVKTRRRHGVPPQPRAWFRAVLNHLPDVARLRVVYADDVAIGAMFTLEFGSSFVYKYAASDLEHSRTGGANTLIWRAIQSAKDGGYRWFDMGRTGVDQAGLATYKERWGARPTPLIYYRYPPPEGGESRLTQAVARWSAPVLRCLPDSLIVAAGRVLYRHVG
jgi:hypothetical protein